MLIDIHNRYPRAYIHRHSLQTPATRQTGFRLQGPAEVHALCEDVLKLVKGVEVDSDNVDPHRGIRRIRTRATLDVTRYALRVTCYVYKRNVTRYVLRLVDVVCYVYCHWSSHSHNHPTTRLPKAWRGRKKRTTSLTTTTTTTPTTRTAPQKKSPARRGRKRR